MTADAAMADHIAHAGRVMRQFATAGRLGQMLLDDGLRIVYSGRMKFSTLMSLPAALALALLPSCQIAQQQQSQTDAEKREKTDEPAPLYLGTVHQVHADRNFVVLRMIGPMPAAGSTLITHPADGSNTRVGNLELRDTRAVRGFITATIRSGTVVSGDAVYLYRDVLRHPGKEQSVSGDPLAPVSGGFGSGTADGTPAATTTGQPTGLTPGSGYAAPPASPTPAVVDPVSDALNAGAAPSGGTATPKPASAPSKDEFPSHLNDIPLHVDDWD